MNYSEVLSPTLQIQVCVCVCACVHVFGWWYLSIFKVVGVGFKMYIFLWRFEISLTYMCFFVKEVYILAIYCLAVVY